MSWGLGGRGPMLSDGRVFVCVYLCGEEGMRKEVYFGDLSIENTENRELFFLQIDRNFFLHPAKFFRR